MGKMSEIRLLPGITVEETHALSLLGVRNGSLLLYLAKTSPMRERLSKETGIDRERLLTLAHLCDMMRVRLMTYEKLGVLRRAGVHKLQHIKRTEPVILHKRIIEAVPAGMVLTDLKSVNSLWLNAFYTDSVIGG